MAKLEKIDIGGYRVTVDRRSKEDVWRRQGGKLELVETKFDSPQAPHLPADTYPGGSQVEGWSPLRTRDPWKVPEPDEWTKRRFADWYVYLRSQIAVYLEIFRRIQPRFLGIPIPIYTLPAILFLVGTALFVPGPALYNLVLVPILLFGLGIKAMDVGTVLVIQPLLWALRMVLKGYLWLADLAFGPKGEARRKYGQPKT